jgi:hypothetical protein
MEIINKDDLLNQDEIVNNILAFETGELGIVDAVVFFHKLHVNGLISKMQGSYGRTFEDMKSMNLINEDGSVNYERLDEIRQDCEEFGDYENCVYEEMNKEVV